MPLLVYYYLFGTTKFALGGVHWTTRSFVFSYLAAILHNFFLIPMFARLLYLDLHLMHTRSTLITSGSCPMQSKPILPRFSTIAVIRCNPCSHVWCEIHLFALPRASVQCFSVYFLIDCSAVMESCFTIIINDIGMLDVFFT